MGDRGTGRDSWLLCWFWLPFVRGSDYSALGPDLGPTVGFAVGVAASALAPFFALSPAFNPRRPRDSPAWRYWWWSLPAG